MCDSSLFNVVYQHSYSVMIYPVYGQHFCLQKVQKALLQSDVHSKSDKSPVTVADYGEPNELLYISSIFYDLFDSLDASGRSVYAIKKRNF